MLAFATSLEPLLADFVFRVATKLAHQQIYRSGNSKLRYIAAIIPPAPAAVPQQTKILSVHCFNAPRNTSWHYLAQLDPDVEILIVPNRVLIESQEKAALRCSTSWEGSTATISASPPTIPIPFQQCVTVR